MEIKRVGSQPSQPAGWSISRAPFASIRCSTERIRRTRRAHPLGQTLIAPGEKHWHGATPTTALTHIAIQEKLDGKNVDWLEKVTEEQYDPQR
jgi:hypothetical protein